jgi:hypothetical protein
MSRNDMPCGDCSVCGELVDHSEAGFCKSCGSAFHWNECGRWVGGEHTCDGCAPESRTGEGHE